MQSMDKRQNTTAEQQAGVEPLQLPGLVKEYSPVDQLPFPDYTPLPSGPLQASYTPFSSPNVTRTLPEAENVTRALPEVQNATRILPTLQTGMFPVTRSATTVLRETVVIRATGKKSSGTMRPPPRGKRLMVHMAVTALLVCIVLGTLLTVIPISGDSHGGFSLFRPITDSVSSRNSSPALIAQQAATATAVTQDGYDPGNNQTYAGLPTAPPDFSGGGGASGGGGLNRFYYGQCTFWANMRYHELTGYWVPWLGNAGAWAYGARAYGWVVSSAPRVPSIIVLPPGVEGAGWYGHVAVVERINADGSVVTSNFNWQGEWAVETIVVFHPGPYVSFVWHP